MDSSSSAQLNEESRAAWNANAATWDEARDRGIAFQDVLTEPAMLRLLGPADGLAIIDAGCGNGHLSRTLANLGARVTAFDFSDELISRARARSAAYGGRISYHAIDGTDPGQLAELAGDAFDAIACSGVLMTMTEIEPLIAAAHRWLKPGGMFVFSVSHPCFNTDKTALMAESIQDPPGEWRTIRSVKVWGYKSVVPMRSGNVKGQALLQVYVDRPLEALLGAFFANGFVMDGVDEPAFPEDAGAPQLDWRGMSEIPGVFAARMRRV